MPNDPTGRVQTVQYIDVGTVLTITPTINPDGYVNLVRCTQTGQQRDEPGAVRRADHQQARSDDAGLHSRWPDDGHRRPRGATRTVARRLRHSVPQPDSAHRPAAVRPSTVRQRSDERAVSSSSRRTSSRATRTSTGCRDAVQDGSELLKDVNIGPAHRAAGRHAAARRDTRSSRTRRRSPRFADDAAPSPAAASPRDTIPPSSPIDTLSRRDRGDSRPSGDAALGDRAARRRAAHDRALGRLARAVRRAAAAARGRRARRSARGSTASSRWRSTTCACCSARAIVGPAVQRARSAHGDSPRVRAGGRDRRGHDRGDERARRARSTRTRFRSTTCCTSRTKRRSCAS